MVKKVLIYEKWIMPNQKYDLNFIFQEIAYSHNKYESVPIVLLGNKSDIDDKRQVKTEEGRKVKQMQFKSCGLEIICLC